MGTTLQQKIYQLFPDLSTKKHFLSWTDEDGDAITISNDEDFQIALTEISGPIYKVDVNVTGTKKLEKDAKDKHSDIEDVKSAKERGRPKIRTRGKHGKGTKNNMEKNKYRNIVYVVGSKQDSAVDEILKDMMGNQIASSGEKDAKKIKMKKKIKIKSKVGKKPSKHSRS